MTFGHLVLSAPGCDCEDCYVGNEGGGSFLNVHDSPEMWKCLQSEHYVPHVCMTHPIGDFCNASVVICELLYSIILTCLTLKVILKLYLNKYLVLIVHLL